MKALKEKSESIISNQIGRSRTTEFLDNEIVLTDHTSVSKFKYSNIQGIKEKGNVVMIFMNNNMALRLYKDEFVDGSWESCKKLIFEKK